MAAGEGLGLLTRYNDGDPMKKKSVAVLCRLCGEEFRAISVTHLLFRHGFRGKNPGLDYLRGASDFEYHNLFKGLEYATKQKDGKKLSNLLES